MQKDYNYSKRLGRLAAYLITSIHAQNRLIFHFSEAKKILGGSSPASKTISQLIKNGVVTQLKARLYQIVPFELGFENEYLGNPYLVARELASHRDQESKAPYYISYGSAFDIHQMTTQPQLIVHISSPHYLRSCKILGTEFRFTKCKPNHMFGLTEIWIGKNDKIQVSDLERTLIDGLKYPEKCGGLSEVAKAFIIKRELIDPQKLIDYATQLNVGAVYRRLGYLMELYEIGPQIYRDFLKTKLTKTYQLLDPELENEGKHIAKWRLLLNVPKEELLALGET